MDAFSSSSTQPSPLIEWTFETYEVTTPSCLVITPRYVSERGLEELGVGTSVTMMFREERAMSEMTFLNAPSATWADSFVANELDCKRKGRGMLVAGEYGTREGFKTWCRSRMKE
jgi:hypothetical protein